MVTADLELWREGKIEVPFGSYLLISKSVTTHTGLSDPVEVKKEKS